MGMMEELLKCLRELDAYLCPEPGGHWSITSIDGEHNSPYFMGWGETPEEAIKEAKKSYVKWCTSKG